MILITGGLGFIGLQTAAKLLERGEQVVLTQYRTSREPEFITPHLGKSCFVEKLDITDNEALLDLGRRHRIDSIIHLAAPGLGRLGPPEEYRVNMLGLYNVLEAAEAWGVRRVSLASSYAVYGGIPRGPFTEDTNVRIECASPTEAFKKSFEILGLHYAERASLDAVVLRIGAIYGPLFHEQLHMPARMAHAAIRGDTNIRGDFFGGDASDFCYVKDCAQGIVMVHQAPGALPHRIYNVGSGHATTFAETAAAVRRVIPGPDFPLKEGRSANQRDNAYMDISRIRQDVGYEPEFVPIDKAVEDYVAWLRDHEE